MLADAGVALVADRDGPVQETQRNGGSSGSHSSSSKRKREEDASDSTDPIMALLGQAEAHVEWRGTKEQLLLEVDRRVYKIKKAGTPNSQAIMMINRLNKKKAWLENLLQTSVPDAPNGEFTSSSLLQSVDTNVQDVKDGRRSKEQKKVIMKALKGYKQWLENLFFHIANNVKDITDEQNKEELDNSVGANDVEAIVKALDAQIKDIWYSKRSKADKKRKTNALAKKRDTLLGLNDSPNPEDVKRRLWRFKCSRVAE